MKKKTSFKYEHDKGVGITWTLFAYLIVFICFVLLVVGIFQVFLLDNFYVKAKTNELYSMATIVEENVNRHDFEERVYPVSAEYSICVLLYKIENAEADMIVSYNILNRCFIHQLAKNGDEIAKLYREAKASDGELIKNTIFKGSRYTTEQDISNTVYVKCFTDKNGNEYVMFLNSQTAPVSAIIKTFSAQFKWIFIILLLGALVLAYIMSRQVTNPIVKLNKSVKKLAKGDYNEKFNVRGYREAIELSNALNHASEELSKTDKLQKDLLANVSHDLRTPLTMIRGYSEMMRDIPGENTPENVQIVIDETTRLSNLVNDMLDISKIQSGERTVEKQVFNLTETVRETLSRYEKLTTKDGYNIKFISDNDASIYADKTMMLQVLYNLINNAINYTGEDKSVTVKQTTTEKKVKIEIIDTGEGIPPDRLALIWDRYYKIDKVHRRAAVGSGLGLSIVKGILEMHKATYGVISTPGEGSNFWFELELSDENRN